MSGLFPTLLGTALGFGILIATAGLRGRAVFGAAAGGHRLPFRTDRMILRLALTVGLGVGIGVVTGWIVGAAIAGVIGFALPSGAGTRGRHDREIARLEAIASWTEQLRDTLAAANGLEHAIAASARVAPADIAGAVDRLAARLEYESLSRALVPFADELDHPLADFVVVALRVAAEREARELGALLGQLADCARGEAQMRLRVWVGRARTRTTVRVVGYVILLSVAGLFLLDRQYLASYDTVAGQVVMFVVAVVFASSLTAMERLGRVPLPDRFVGRRFEDDPAMGAPR